MPQIDVPFLPGDKVRVKGGTGTVYTVHHLEVGDVKTAVWVRNQLDVVSCRPDSLEAVTPVIERRRHPGKPGWVAFGTGWFARDDGGLVTLSRRVGFFSDPRAVAEETQALWNERAVSNEREGK